MFLRYIMPQVRWRVRAAKLSFCSLNFGLAWMVFATLFPLGILQLYHSVSTGYFEARSLGYISSHTNTLLEWLRLPGDALFIAGGVLPILFLAWRGAVRPKPSTAVSESQDFKLSDIAQATASDR